MRTRYRVLVVDDNNDTVETISTVLESAGFDVIPADSGSACRELIETCDPDILILDVMLDTLTEGLTVYCDIRGIRVTTISRSSSSRQSTGKSVFPST